MMHLKKSMTHEYDSFRLFTLLVSHLRELNINTFALLSVKSEYKNGTTDDVWTILWRNIPESRICKDERTSRSVMKK